MNYYEAIKMDKIYSKIPLEKIPWNFQTPPATLVDLVNSRKVKPCKTVDMGCGTGNYAIYLGSLGFDVTGFDVSKSAVKIAIKNAKKKNIKASFLVADVLSHLEIGEKFDFAYDWELLHHIFPDKREIYVKNVYKILKREGKYLSVCFSEKDVRFGGSGKYRSTKLDTVLYFSSLTELKELFTPYFDIVEAKIIKIRGKPFSHFANYIFMKKKR
jgi:SAM-dependent methyltransferase